ncbi:MAG TPA: hypothetical protein VIV12_08180 [Streptosporangiaceae bacterium]
MDSPSPITRRAALRSAGALAAATAALDMVGSLAFLPERVLAATTPSDIQFDIEAFLTTQPQVADTGVRFRMPPVHTGFATAKLLRTPGRADQAELERVLRTLEQHYPWGAGSLVTFVSYGLPYFRRLPGGLTGHLVSGHMPRLLKDPGRYALEEAVPGPSDVSASNPGVSKLRYNVPVVIENNDVLFTLRSDRAGHVADVLAWFGGSNQLRGQTVRSPAWRRLLRFTSSRYMFVQMGLPRAVAEQNKLPFRHFIQPQSPMWMGFADQQTNASGPAPICTFAGAPAARFTTAAPGDYFDNGAIQHLSHVLLDLLQFFDMETPSSEPGGDGVFSERVQYMFHAPGINPGYADQYIDGGGPSFLPNQNLGPGYAEQTAQGIGTDIDQATGLGERRLGHLSALQRSSRAADGTPVHIRMDGPGFDRMDVPGGGRLPKLQFTIFVPSADFFATLRQNQAAADLATRYQVPQTSNGLERFITATRRQNYLVPPRRHRAFPLIELPARHPA